MRVGSSPPLARPDARVFAACSPLSCRLVAALVVTVALGVPAAHAQHEGEGHAPAPPLVLPPVQVETTALAFDDAVAAMVADDPQLAAVAFDLRAARSRMQGALAPFDWTLQSQFDIARSEQPVDDGLSSGESVSESWRLDASIGRRWATGTSIEFGLQNGLSRSVFPLSSSLIEDRIIRGPNVSSVWSATVSQSLLQGFGREVNLLPVLLARRSEDLARAQWRGQANARLVELATAWIELRRALDEIELREGSLERTETLRVIGEAELRAGRIAPIELDRLEERRIANYEALLVAVTTAEERSRQLQRTMGADPAAATTLWAPAPVAPPTPPESLDAACATARDAHPSDEALRARIETARADRVRTRDLRRPSLEVSAGVSHAGLDPGWFDSWGQALGLRATTVFGAVVFSMPLQRTAAIDEQTRAEIEIDRATWDLEVAGRERCWDLVELVGRLDAVDRRRGVADARVVLARRALDAEEARFAQGLSTVQAGLDALEQLETTELAVAANAAESELLRWQIAWQTGALADLWLHAFAPPESP